MTCIHWSGARFIPSKGMNEMNLLFQRKVEMRYESDWLRKLFENFDCRVVYLDTNPPRTEEDTRKNAVRIWEEHLE